MFFFDFFFVFFIYFFLGGGDFFISEFVLIFFWNFLVTKVTTKSYQGIIIFFLPKQFQFIQIFVPNILMTKCNRQCARKDEKYSFLHTVILIIEKNHIIEKKLIKQFVLCDKQRHTLKNKYF